MRLSNIIPTLFLISFGVVSAQDPIEPSSNEAPNVLIVMNANSFEANGKNLQTTLEAFPSISKLHKSGVTWNQFYANPISSATQASALTGRYNIRTKSSGSGQGRAMMATDEVTIAEAFAGAGYYTGFFGKWYLGNNYPMRSSDQGFEVSSMLSDSLASDEQALWIDQNHETLKSQDVVATSFESARKFIQSSQTKQRPFLCIISIPEIQPVLNPGKSLDDEIGKTVDFLQASSIKDNTLIVFLNDSRRSVSTKGSETYSHTESLKNKYLLSPLIIDGPIGTNRDEIETSSPRSAIDLMPTLMERCGLGIPEALNFDGVNLLKKKKSNESKEGHLHTVVFQDQATRSLSKFDGIMLRRGIWKLTSSRISEGRSPRFYLYNLSEDPDENNNLAASNTDKLQDLKSLYSTWFDDVTYTRIRNRGVPEILLNRDEENPVRLTQENRIAMQNSSKTRGVWKVSFEHSGRFDLIAHISPAESLKFNHAVAVLSIGDDLQFEQQCNDQGRALFEGVDLPQGKQTIEAKFTSSDGKTTLYAIQMTLIHR